MAASLKLKPGDNVSTMLDAVEAGGTVSVINERREELLNITAVNKIPFGHKIALCDINENENVIKCASTIGKASKNIRCGEHVHIHNVESIEGRRGVKPRDAGEG